MSFVTHTDTHTRTYTRRTLHFAPFPVDAQRKENSHTYFSLYETLRRRIHIVSTQQHEKKGRRLVATELILMNCRQEFRRPLGIFNIVLYMEMMQKNQRFLSFYNIVFHEHRIFTVRVPFYSIEHLNKDKTRKNWLQFAKSNKNEKWN